jgi:hypothetical protein
MLARSKPATSAATNSDIRVGDRIACYAVDKVARSLASLPDPASSKTDPRRSLAGAFLV